MPSPGQIAAAGKKIAVADPLLGSDYAWRASDAADNGTLVTSIPAYIGTAVLALSSGSGQPKKASSANFLGHQVLPCNGGGTYTLASMLGAAPAGITIASVFRTSSVNRGVCALTVGSGANSGTAQYRTSSGSPIIGAPKASTFTCQKTLPGSDPVSVVAVSVVDASGVTLYANSATPATSAVAGALAGTTWTLLGLSPTGTFTYDGEWVTTGIWLSALSGVQALAILNALGAKYGVTISP